MLFNPTTFIGIDPTAGHKPFVYAALDSDLRTIAIGAGKIEEILAFAAGQHKAWVAVCSPRRPNQGIMARKEVRENLLPVPSGRYWMDFRLADYWLRKRNISIPQTPSQAEKCPNWMQMGFMVYKQLVTIGYEPYPGTGSELLSLEVYPHASYTAMMEIIPFPKNTLEGRLQRQLALYDRNVKIPDPMLIFEEITRHRLLKGILPLDHLLSASELDALVAAYTAWLAATHPDQVSVIGDPDEGQIVLPVAELRQHY